MAAAARGPDYPRNKCPEEGRRTPGSIVNLEPAGALQMAFNLVPHSLAAETQRPPLQNGITGPWWDPWVPALSPPPPSMQLPGCMVSNHTQGCQH